MTSEDNLTAEIAAPGDEMLKKESSLFVLYLKQKRPPPDVIRKLHPKIVDVRVPRSKSAKFCIIEFENPESAMAAKHDLNRNTDISVRLRRKENKVNPEKFAKKQEKKLKRKLKAAEAKNLEGPPKKRGKLSNEPGGLSQRPINAKPKKQTTNGSPKKTGLAGKTKGGKKEIRNPVKRTLAQLIKKNLTPPKVSTSNLETEGPEELPPVDPCSLYVKGLPLLASQEILLNLYPQSTKIEISAKKVNGKRCGLVYFASEKEAAEALESSSGISVNGETLNIARCLDHQ